MLRARPYYMSTRVKRDSTLSPRSTGDRVYCPSLRGFEFGLAEEFQERLRGGVETFFLAVNDA